MPKPTLANLTWLFAYLTMVAAITWGFFYARAEAMPQLDTEAAREDWQAWRDDAQKQTSDGRKQSAERGEPVAPVQRSQPKSPVPNGLVLLRDYFVQCLTIALLLSSILFAVMMIFIRGAVATKYQPELAEDLE